MAYRWEFDKLVQEIDNLQQRAHAIGLHVTGHALNRAKNACGWEFAGDVDQAAKAAAHVPNAVGSDTSRDR